MSKSFDDALKIWALKYLHSEKPHLRATEIVSVDVRYEEESGYCETCHDPRHLSINITYVDGNGDLKDTFEWEYDPIYLSEYELLQELFKEE